MLNSNANSEAYHKRWVVHADVDEDDALVNSCFEKSKKSGVRYDIAADHMRFLSASDRIFFPNLGFLLIFS